MYTLLKFVLNGIGNIFRTLFLQDISVFLESEIKLLLSY